MGQGLGHGHLGQLLGRIGAERPAAGRQHHPADLLPPAGLQGLEDGAVLAIDRQDAGLFVAASRVTSGPATTRLSLLAKATVLPASRAAQVPCRPALPTMADTTMSTSGSAHHAGNASGPTSNSVSWGRPDQSCRAAAAGSVATIQRGLTARACSSSSARLRWAVRATARSRPSEAAITSSVLRPMLPVEPRMATLVLATGHRSMGLYRSATPIEPECDSRIKVVTVTARISPVLGSVI